MRKLRRLGKGPKMPAMKQSRAFSYPKVQPPKDPLEAAAVQGVVASLPERIVWKWLVDHGHLFTTQKAELSSPQTVGGTTVDFVVYSLAPQPVVFRVQGVYWHGPEFPGARAHDDEQAGRLRRQGYLVVDLRENDIYEAVLRKRLTRYIEKRLFL